MWQAYLAQYWDTFSDLERASFSREFFQQIEPFLANDNQPSRTEHLHDEVPSGSTFNSINNLNIEEVNLDLPQVNKNEEKI